MFYLVEGSSVRVFVLPEENLEMGEAAFCEDLDENLLVGADFVFARRVEGFDVRDDFAVVHDLSLVPLGLQQGQKHLLEVAGRVALDVVLQILVKH